MNTHMSNPQEPPRKEVTYLGKFLALGILGTGMIVSIFIENVGVPENVERIPYILLGALVLSVAIPMAFCRRVVR